MGEAVIQGDGGPRAAEESTTASEELVVTPQGGPRCDRSPHPGGGTTVCYLGC